jgi:chlorobactene glucosyltransferase
MLAFSLVVLAVWALCGLFTVINLLIFHRLPSLDPPGARESWPRVSLVIPARNEERAIGPTLDAALGQDYPHFEVIVVDDCSTDRTPVEIAARAGDPRLRPLTGTPPPPGWLGKPHALATGTALARGEFLLFIDADVRLAPETLRHAVGHCLRQGLDHLALFPHFVRKGFWEEALMPILAVTGLIYLPSFLAISRRLRRLALGGGAFNLVRESAYSAVGGHRKLANSVVDDVRLAMEVKRAGYASTMRLGNHLVSLRMYHGRRELVEGFTKNTHAVVPASLRRYWIVAGLGVLVGSVLQLAPFFWLVWLALFPGEAFSSAGRTLFASFLILLATRFTVQARMGYPLWPVLAHPLMVLVSAEIQLRSLLMAHRDRVVRWREREYPHETTTF